jgi:uncharacterized delta-60 repeat protein
MTDYTETVASFGNGFDATQFNTSVLESTIVSTLISISNDGTTITFTFTPALSTSTPDDKATFDAIVLDMRTNGPDDIPETNILPGIELVNTTESVDISSGAMVVAGGAGIAKSINVGGSVTVGDAATTEMKIAPVYDSPISDTGFAGTGVYEHDFLTATGTVPRAFVIIGDILYTTGYCNPVSGTNDYFVSAVHKTTGVPLATYQSGEPLLVLSNVASSQSLPRGIYDMGDGTHIVVVTSTINGDYDILLRRYDNATGALITGYGSGGTATIGVGGVDERAWSAVQQTSTTVSVSTSTDSVDVEVYRIVLETGALDTTFGGGTGVVTLSIPSVVLIEPRCSAVQQDGSVLCAGYVNFGSGNEVFVTRFDIDGNHDTSFSPGSAVAGVYLDNTLVFPIIRVMQVYADNSICISGYVSSDVHFARLTEDGIQDTSFNGTGVLTLNPGAFDRCDYMFPVTAGYVYASINITTSTDGAIIRLNELGMDLTFADNGYLDVQTGAANDLVTVDGFHLEDGVIYAGDAKATLKIAKFDTDGGVFTIYNNVNVQGTVSTAVPPTLPKHLTNKNYIDDLIASASPTGTRIKLLKQSVQSIPFNTGTVVTWPTTEFNINCTVDPSEKGIIINEDGWYQIGYEVNLADGINRRASWMDITRAATGTSDGRRYSENELFMDGSSAAIWAANGTTIVELFAGDSISVWVFHTHTVPRNVPVTSATGYICELYATKLSTPILPVVETTSVATPLIDLTSTATSSAVLTRGTMVNDDNVEGGSGNLFQEFIASDGRTRYTLNSAGEARWNMRDDMAVERGTFTIGTPAGGVGIILNEDDPDNRKHIFTLNKTIYVTHGAATGVGPRLLNTHDAWSTTSDQRLKENIVECTGDLDKLSNIHGYCYNYIGDATERVGVIAQEVQAQYPIAVGTIEGVDEASGLSDILVVKYTELIPNMINAINELNVIATDLKSRIETLESA